MERVFLLLLVNGLLHSILAAPSDGKMNNYMKYIYRWKPLVILFKRLKRNHKKYKTGLTEYHFHMQTKFIKLYIAY